MRHTISYKGEPHTVIVDDEHDELMLQYKWRISKQGNKAYVKVLTKGSAKERKTIYLHRLIMDAPNGLVVDHINHNGLDNQKMNLRVIEHWRNIGHRQAIDPRNKSGVSGVCWDKSRKQWQVSFSFRSKIIRLGRFDDIEDAEIIAKEMKAFLLSERGV